MPNPDPPAELAPLASIFRGYALGLDVRDYRGHKVLTHTGGLPGYVSRVLLVPDIGLGVSVLTNQESGEAFNALAYYVVDQYLGATAIRLGGAYHNIVRGRALAAWRTPTEERAARAAASTPSLPLARTPAPTRPVVRRHPD